MKDQTINHQTINPTQDNQALLDEVSAQLFAPSPSATATSPTQTTMPTDTEIEVSILELDTTTPEGAVTKKRFNTLITLNGTSYFIRVLPCEMLRQFGRDANQMRREARDQSQKFERQAVALDKQLEALNAAEEFDATAFDALTAQRDALEDQQIAYAEALEDRSTAMQNRVIAYAVQDWYNPSWTSKPPLDEATIAGLAITTRRPLSEAILQRSRTGEAASDFLA